MKNKLKIVIFGKEPDFNDFLKFYLKKEGFGVKLFNELKSLKQIGEQPDLFIIDSSVSQDFGFDYCGRFAKSSKFQDVPVVVLLESEEQIKNKKNQCELANILFKPVSSSLLISKVKSSLKRNNKLTNNYFKEAIEIGPLKLDPNNFSLMVDGRELQLPKKEFQILALLLNNPNKVFSRQQILDSVWGEKVIVINRTVDVHVRKIREKLGRFSNIIETVKGIGYKYSEL